MMKKIFVYSLGIFALTHCTSNKTIFDVSDYGIQILEYNHELFDLRIYVRSLERSDDTIIGDFFVVDASTVEPIFDISVIRQNGVINDTVKFNGALGLVPLRMQWNPHDTLIFESDGYNPNCLVFDDVW